MLEELEARNARFYLRFIHLVIRQVISIYLSIYILLVTMSEHDLRPTL